MTADTDARAARTASAVFGDLAVDATPPTVTWPKGFIVDGSGTYWHPEGDGRGGERPAALWLCGYLTVIAEAREKDGGDWSKVIEFKDRDGRVKREIIGMAELAGDGVAVRGRLMAQGLTISTNKAARERLQSGLILVTCSARNHFASAAGWNDDLYVLPHRTIGPAGGEGVLYRGKYGATLHGERGTQQGWRDQVAARASGNAFLLFGLSCAFAGPLLRLLDGEGGGFHIRGGSSSGKTTVLQVAGSVWGGGGNSGFAQSWRSTDNALEGLALAHNDCLLPLDELKMLDAAAAGQAAYALATGVSKARMRPDAEMKPRPTWRVMILSAGELGMPDLIRSARGNDKSYAGQELRLLDLEADLGEGLGAWQTVHEASGPSAFSDGLKAATNAHYGHAGPLFVERFIEHREESKAALLRLQAAFLEDVTVPGDTGQAQRGAQRFATVAAAGELACRLDVVPWRPGEAAAACRFLFEKWAAQFGRDVPREDREAIGLVRDFIEKWGSSRFRQHKTFISEREQEEEEMRQQADMEAGKPRQGEARSLDTAGYKGNMEGKGELYHFNPAVFARKCSSAWMPRMLPARSVKPVS